MVIGFEHASQMVSEDAGDISVCLRILQPSGVADRIMETSYSINVATQATGGKKLDVMCTIRTCMYA